MHYDYTLHKMFQYKEYYNVTIIQVNITLIYQPYVHIISCLRGACMMWMEWDMKYSGDLEYSYTD